MNNCNPNSRDEPVLMSSLGSLEALLEEVVVGVPPARSLANLRIREELGIVALESPEPVRPERVAPHLLGLVTAILYRIHVLSEFSVPLLGVLHHPQDQVLRKFHYETHSPEVTRRRPV